MKAVTLILILFLEFSQIQEDDCFRYPSPILNHYVYKRVVYETEDPIEHATTTPPSKPVPTQPEALVKLKKCQKAMDKAFKRIRKLLDKGFKFETLPDLAKSRLT